MKKIFATIIAVMMLSMVLVPAANAAIVLNLPADPVTVSLELGVDKWPGTVTVSGITGGPYDVSNGEYTGWCAEFDVTIVPATPYQAILVSSLTQATPWDKINYLLNHATSFNMDVQAAIWLLLGVSSSDITARYPTQPSTEANALFNASTAAGTGFDPTYGEWIAVICDNQDGAQDLIIQIQIEEEEEFEGLTPGFWKNHPDVWASYSPDDKFNDVFGTSIAINGNTDPTLMDALNAKGGINEEKGVYDALARHAVAALLNAAHPDVNYPMTEQDIIDAVFDVIQNANLTDAEPLKNTLDAYNNAGGGIDAHGNPI